MLPAAVPYVCLSVVPQCCAGETQFLSHVTTRVPENKLLIMMDVQRAAYICCIRRFGSGFHRYFRSVRPSPPVSRLGGTHMSSLGGTHMSFRYEI